MHPAVSKADAESKRKAALAEIDDEVARLRGIAADKQRFIDEDELKHPLDQAEQETQRLRVEIGNIRKAVGNLMERRSEIEINGVPVARAVEQAPRVKGQWEIKNLPRPTYPAGARKRGDKAALNAAFDDFIEYYIDRTRIALSEHDVDPSANASINLLAQVSGESTGVHYWVRGRIKELEERVAELEQLDARLKEIEARPTKTPITRSLTKVTSHDSAGRIATFEKIEGDEQELDLLEQVEQLQKRLADLEAEAMRHGGTWKQGVAYGRGTAITDKGSMWLAQRATTDRPGTSDAWKLVVKSGQVR